MSKLLTFVALFGVLTIFFLGMGINVDPKPVLEMPDFEERSYPQTPAFIILEAKPEPIETPKHEVVYAGEDRYFSDHVTPQGKPLLQRTDAGQDVAELQAMLNEQGASLDIDGHYGDETRQAVMDFQADNGLAVDGFTGAETWGALLDLQDEQPGMSDSQEGVAGTNK